MKMSSSCSSESDRRNSEVYSSSSMQSNSRTSSAGETVVRSSREPQLGIAWGPVPAFFAATGSRPDMARDSGSAGAAVGEPQTAVRGSISAADVLVS
ncbi:hypothetical protein CgunFtcFv8_026578 [Champsocephalus gunnari]|uniref:Uncharacterized protein n=1 Tax=Champsocephalus gunnari TaxID=52237 RepID=A0AAN8HWF6_CHAGU|nr:hypothetical protein CgunFtcFv8_026578 [Champsocephalus gunnari]